MLNLSLPHVHDISRQRAQAGQRRGSQYGSRSGFPCMCEALTPPLLLKSDLVVAEVCA